MIVPGGKSPGQEGNDGALLLTSRNKGGERNDRLRNVVSRHYDHHACICRIELLQGQSIGTSRHPARTVWRLQSISEGRSSTAASSLPALLLYHLHEAPSSPFAANNAFARRIGLPQGRQIEKRAAIQRELSGGSISRRRGEAHSSVIPSCSFIIPSP